MRKPGWYWVKHDGEWMVAYYGVLSWAWMYMDVDGFDEMKVYEDKDVPFSEIGPRIPTPDEPWQCVPKEPTREMLAAGEYALEAGCYASGIYADMLSTAPKLETQP